MTVAQTPILGIRKLTKRFGGTLAVDCVSFDVHAGEIVALLGENGAGKSTLIKMLAGVYSIDQGAAELDGQPLKIGKSARGEEQPLAFIHQDLGLIEWMTVAENIALGTGFPRRRGLIDWKRLDAIAQEALARVGCNLHPGSRVFTLSRTEKSLLAIARALWVKARLLVLDEPTASLPAQDVQRLFRVLRELRAQGVAMIYVSHRLDEVMQLCDRAAIMRDGRLVAVAETAQLDEAHLVELIVGRPVGLDRTEPAPTGATQLLVRDLRVGFVGPVDFKVDAGEILGLVGLRGGGQELVSRALFGAFPRTSGRMSVAGRACAPATPAQAIAAGIGLVASDRLEENLARGMSVQENLFLRPAQERGVLRRLDRAVEAQRAREWVNRLDIRPPAPHAYVEDLSGGNQQKVVLARWIELGKPVLILEEPTAGVDVGAKAEIYGLLRELARNGTAIVVVSTDFEEVAHLCTRALVFARGQIVKQLAHTELTTASLLRAAAGSAAAPRTLSSPPTPIARRRISS
jgi:ribose transport system ATP-binding protein